MNELHLSKKDFRLEWYSGEGKGGQHRNKKQCCCRITHIATGIAATGTRYRSRVQNQKAAFAVLAARLIAHYTEPPYSRRQDGDRIRTYSEASNRVVDHASGMQMRFTDVIGKGNVGPMIEANRDARAQEEGEQET